MHAWFITMLTWEIFDWKDFWQKLQVKTTMLEQKMQKGTCEEMVTMWGDHIVRGWLRCEEWSIGGGGND